MASRSVTTQLNHIIDSTFSNIEQFERFDRYTTLQSLHTALDHQVEDGSMRLDEYNRMRFIVGKLWELKLQLYLEKEADVLSLMLDLYGGCDSKVIACLYVFEMMSRLMAKGIIRSFSMRKRRRATVKPVTGIIADCDVCGGFMFNAQRYMSMNDAYFTPPAIRFPYEMKKVFDRILHELQ